MRAFLVTLTVAAAWLLLAGPSRAVVAERPEPQAPAPVAGRSLASGSWQCLEGPRTSSGRPVALHALDMVSPTFGVGISQTAVVMYRDGTWQGQQSPFAQGMPCPGCWRQLLDVDMVSESEGWIVGERGAMLHYQNGEWQVVTPPADASDAWLTDISMVDATEGWAVSDRLFLHYHNGAWEVVPSPTTQALKVIDMVNPSEGWAATTEGTFVHYTGGSWQVADRPTTEEIHDLDMASADSGWALAELKILHYDGTSWSVQYQREGWEAIAAVAAASESEAWAAARGATLFHFVNGGWQEVPNVCCPVEYESIFTDLQMLSPEEGWGTGSCLPYRAHYVMRYTTTGDSTLERHGLYLPGLSRLAPWPSAVAGE